MFDERPNGGSSLLRPLLPALSPPESIGSYEDDFAYSPGSSTLTDKKIARDLRWVCVWLPVKNKMQHLRERRWCKFCFIIRCTSFLVCCTAILLKMARYFFMILELMWQATWPSDAKVRVEELLFFAWFLFCLDLAGKWVKISSCVAVRMLNWLVLVNVRKEIRFESVKMLPLLQVRTV